MVKHQFFSCLIVSFLILIEANAHQEFLQCISSHSAHNFKKRIHPPNSTAYSSLIQHAQKNPRWLNSSTLPIFIITPKTEPEIQPIILCSKKFGLQIRVKSGGHDYEGLSFRAASKVNFAMVDLFNLDEIKIDEVQETSWIQTGVTMGQLYYAIAKKSRVLAFPGGLYPSVGSGGIISGGGIGTLMRKFGLAADNVIDARVMNVNGKIVDRKSMGEDMFWAIRGGGGASFGIVLAWKLKLVKVPPKLTAFTVRRKLEGNTINLLQRWQTVSHKLPNDLFMRVLLQNRGSGKDKFVQVSFQGLFLGMVSEFIPLVNQTFHEFELVEQDCYQDPVVNCTEMPCVKKECFEVPWIRTSLYFASKRTNDSLEILVNARNTLPKIKNYYKATSDFVKRPMPKEVWEMIKDMFMKEEVPMIILDPLGGKMDDISEFEIPFPHRKENLFNVQYMVNWGDNSESISSKKIKWLRKLYKKMKPFVSHSPRTAYLNYRDLDFGTNNEGGFSYSKAKVWGAKYYNGNFERLAKVKSKVDPVNFFKFEQSIPPFHVSS